MTVQVDLVCYFLSYVFYPSKLNQVSEVQTGLAAAFRCPDLILQGDHTLSREATSISNEEDL